MAVYLSFFLISFAGIFIIFWRRFRQVRYLSPDELKLRLLSSRSVRLELKESVVEPLKVKFRENILPAFWKSSEKIVRRFRVSVLRFEAQLKNLSDKLRGKHVNLEVSEKSEYWESLNHAKENAKNVILDLEENEKNRKKNSSKK
jgi:hypothetical protein